MCRRYSRGSNDIRRLSKNVRLQERRERFGRDEFHGALKQALQQIAERHKAIKTLLARLEFDEKIDVTVGTGRVPVH